MIAKKEALKQRHTKQVAKYLTNLNESQIPEDPKTDFQKSTLLLEAPLTKRERASIKKEKKAKEEAKEKEVRPLLMSSTPRVEMAPIVPPSNPDNDSRVYEVDIDVDTMPTTKEKVWEVKQKDEVKERVEQVKEQQNLKKKPKTS